MKRPKEDQNVFIPEGIESMVQLIQNNLEPIEDSI